MAPAPPAAAARAPTAAAPEPRSAAPRSRSPRARAEIEDVAAGILRVTDAAGGFVASSSVSGGSGSGGTFELRIPVARLDKAVADLSRLANVRERTQSSRDITAETVSARERLREARREREGLLRALASATTLNETEAVKARLRDVNRQIATARASLRRVGNRATYANVSVQLVAERGRRGRAARRRRAGRPATRCATRAGARGRGGRRR